MIDPALFTGDTLLVGHSQGGHAVLSALAMHASYGSGGNLAGVVAYAPSWFPMTSFGALLAEPGDYPIATNYDTVAASVWYHYTHAELLDGPGAGPLLFAADKRDAIRTFVETSCDESALVPLGTTVADLFDPTFTDAIAVPAGLGTVCVQDPCSTWMARYQADRPHITGAATGVPVLIPYGTVDEWIPADRETCGFDRLTTDKANDTVCVVPGADHDGVVGARSAYVSAWIASKTLGGGDPGACGLAADALVDDAGAPIVCLTTAAERLRRRAHSGATSTRGAAGAIRVFGKNIAATTARTDIAATASKTRARPSARRPETVAKRSGGRRRPCS